MNDRRRVVRFARATSPSAAYSNIVAYNGSPSHPGRHPVCRVLAHLMSAKRPAQGFFHIPSVRKFVFALLMIRRRSGFPAVRCALRRCTQCNSTARCACVNLGHPGGSSPPAPANLPAHPGACSHPAPMGHPAFYFAIRPRWISPIDRTARCKHDQRTAVSANVRALLSKDIIIISRHRGAMQPALSMEPGASTSGSL